ncbi:hypothetical protein TCEA9_00120 [Thermobrachium celere]|nr:hypothetical protein TCEA9_00120 [Thermobrachium celere]
MEIILVGKDPIITPNMEPCGQCDTQCLAYCTCYTGGYCYLCIRWN